MPDSVRLEFPELERKLRKLESMDRSQLHKIDRALWEAANEVISLAKQIVPVAPDGGTLRGTLRVDKGRGSTTVSEVELVAGGPAAPYAFAVHEAVEGNLSKSFMPPAWRKLFSIRWSTPGTGPKYLERPLRESAKHIGDMIDRAISEALREVR